MSSWVSCRAVLNEKYENEIEIDTRAKIYLNDLATEVVI